MGIARREYTLTVNQFREPEVLEDSEAVAMLLLRLIIMSPGTDPLHPDMGVGIAKYRYGIDNLDDLRKKTQEQIKTYLPMFVDSTVKFTLESDHILRVTLQIANVEYYYDMNEDDIPVDLEQIANG